jgi:uncharacterized protein
MSLTAEAVIDLLGLARHPEGGWYRETFRDPSPAGGSVAGGGTAGGAGGTTDAGKRGASSAIYYLLQRGERSAWHRVTDAVEAWHHYAGAPLALRVSLDGRTVATHRLGPDLVAGERPQAVVPAGAWQAAESLGDWTLVGCTVAPAFDFASFELAPAGWEPGG